MTYTTMKLRLGFSNPNDARNSQVRKRRWAVASREHWSGGEGLLAGEIQGRCL